MPIRITGMYSGLDTESIINELASAQSAKKNSLVKAQTKLSWKQDAWKALNTKIYSLYTKLDDLRFQSAYMKKATKVSNSNAVSVVTSSDSVNGVQTMNISKMAKAGYLTGGEISAADGSAVKKSSTLSDLGFTGEGSFSVAINGKSTEIKITGDTKISEVVSQLQSAGVNANFDEKNQRFFISSKTTGAKQNFNLVGNNAEGMEVLSKLGLLTTEDLKSDEYTKWANYKNADGSYTADYDTALAAEIEKRAKAYKTANENLEKTNTTLQEKIDKLKEDPGYIADKTADELYEELYGPEVQKTDEKGDLVYDDDGKPVMERQGGLQAVLDQEKEALAAAQEELEAAKKSGVEADITAAQAKVDAANQAVTEKTAEFNEVNGQYSMVKAVEDTQAQIDANNQTISDNAAYFTVDADGNAVPTTALTDQVTAEFEAKIQNAQNVVNNSPYQASPGATKVTGQDAEISLNGAYFTSSTNTFEINGLTITVQEETSETITLTTSEDTDSIYDMIKSFFKDYNALINEMDALYNAESSKGYEPLLSEEKDAMSDTEIEEWEKKIKDSLLRRDATLSDVSGAMKTVMLQGATVNGKKMYLSDFGINTLGYFKAADNEKNAYHIDGDQDDENSAVKTADDVLKSMIASDPDTVMSFFTQLANNLHDELDKKMSRTSMSSAFTVYNDKEMKEEYDAYTEKISKQETKLNDLIDKWYSKFSAMETALSKLESKNSAISSLFGG
ncbi:MAG: flagellar filament capping protein FliD [Lachnospiraceae bacterium]|nr:flagellar filament capping protein FliD [Lachnospiraceae bacterium]